MKSLLLVCVSLFAFLPASRAGSLTWTFAHPNPTGLEFIIQRRSAVLTEWPANPVEVIGAAIDLGPLDRTSGGATVARAGYTLTASANVFEPTDVGCLVTWNAVTTAVIDSYENPRTVTTIGSGTIPAGPVTIITRRLRVIEPRVAPGLWVGRVAARAVGGTKLSPWSNDSNRAEIAPWGPVQLQGEETAALINVSTRGVAGFGDDALIVGFVARGRGKILARGVGPSLAQAPFNLGGVIAAPQITLVRMRDGAAIAGNAGWADDPELARVSADVFAFPFLPGSADAAIVAAFEPGAYTMLVTPAAGAPGRALGEVYLVPN